MALEGVNHGRGRRPLSSKKGRAGKQKRLRKAGKAVRLGLRAWSLEPSMLCRRGKAIRTEHAL